MRKLFAALVALCILLTSTMPAFAAPCEAAPVDDGGPYYISYDKDGNILSYNMPIPLESTLAEDGTYLSSRWLDSGKTPDVDCGFHPDYPLWIKTSEYVFESEKSFMVYFSTTVKGKIFDLVDLSGSVQVSIGAATNSSFKVPADPSRFSRLKVICRFDYTLWHGDVCDAYTNEVLYSFEYTTYVKTHEAFEPIYDD